LKTANRVLKYETKSGFDFIDFTEEVVAFLSQTPIRNGLVNIQILHTSAALVLNENEPLLLADLKASLERMAPENDGYQHDDFTKRTVNLCDDECVNGHSHCKAIRLPVNVTLNLVDGRLQLGQWQRIMLVELDRSRPRQVQIQVIGE
jgi:secondary thiamine-phosphate synthase enzyme